MLSKISVSCTMLTELYELSRYEKLSPYEKLQMKDIGLDDMSFYIDQFKLSYPGSIITFYSKGESIGGFVPNKNLSQIKVVANLDNMQFYTY